MGWLDRRETRRAHVRTLSRQLIVADPLETIARCRLALADCTGAGGKSGYLNPGRNGTWLPHATFNAIAAALADAERRLRRAGGAT